MSSPYLEWKYKDVTPEEPRKLTKTEQLKNWWHYHKLPLLLAALLLFIAGGILKSALHIGEILPDMQVAYVGEHPLPADTVAAVEQAFDAFATDANGDGRTVVRLVQYVSGSAEDADAVRQSTAASVALLADLEDRDSYFFFSKMPRVFNCSTIFCARKTMHSPTAFTGAIVRHSPRFRSAATGKKYSEPKSRETAGKWYPVCISHGAALRKVAKPSTRMRVRHSGKH